MGGCFCLWSIFQYLCFIYASTQGLSFSFNSSNGISSFTSCSLFVVVTLVGERVITD